jgi:glycosyltransferase involved in cell wall biosynthesis
MPDSQPRATLSVAIITFNEEENIGRTLASVKDIADEIILVDSGSTDRTVEIAKQFGAKVFIEEWKGFAAQKNSALDKCTCDWILSLDADEEVSAGLQQCLGFYLEADPVLVQMRNGARLPEDVWKKAEDRAFDAGALEPYMDGAFIPRKNIYLNRFLKRGGLYPDSKLRFFRRGKARFENRKVHEDVVLEGQNDLIGGDLIHHQYPTLTAYIEHMNRYSSLGAEMVLDRRADKRGRVGFSILNIVVRPIATFIYNYFFRLGFLDGKEGLLLHLYHSVYVSWKYAKAWELSRKNNNQ